MIHRLKTAIEDAGKKAYILSIGKINPAKLANFQDIDVFVSVSCPISTIDLMANAGDYYHPVVTPFELDLALNSREWTGRYSVDFGELVEKMKYDLEGNEEEETYYSLIDGTMKMKSNRNVHKEQKDSTSHEIQLASHPRDIVLSSSLAATSFNRREFRGLDPRIGETEVQKAVIGLSGIAMGYDGELSE
jgi:diphthamide biosynthesis protein 2